MSPEERSAISDHPSEIHRRGRPPISRDRVLRAAETLLASSDAPATVSMDDIAAAAGVGKGTLFRGFGSRDGLLDAVFAARLEPLRAEVERTGSPVGPDVPASQRATALLGLLLDFKLDNPRLVAARELDGSDLLRAPHYQWVHGLLRSLLEQAGCAPRSACYEAHLLLNGLRADLIAELTATGLSRQELRDDMTTTIQKLLR